MLAGENVPPTQENTVNISHRQPAKVIMNGDEENYYGKHGNLCAFLENNS